MCCINALAEKWRMQARSKRVHDWALYLDGRAVSLLSHGADTLGCAVACLVLLPLQQVGHKWTNGSDTLAAGAAVHGDAPNNSTICTNTTYSFTASFGPFGACTTMQVGSQQNG